MFTPTPKQYGDANITMNEAAKILGIGRNKLFIFLRDQRILCTDNTPYQKHLDQGHFTVAFKDILNRAGSLVRIQPVTLVTAKGLKYLQNLLQKGSGPNDGWDDDDEGTSFSITIQLK